MYKGGFNMGGGNMQNLLKQAQKMQAEMQAQQEKAEQELEAATIKATAGGGMVSVEMSGKGEVKTLKINPQAVDPDDVEMLEDLVIACINDAIKQVKELEEKLKPTTNGLM